VSRDGVRRREDPRLVTGAGQFVDDLRLAGSVHVAILRSPHAHAAIRGIDTAAAAGAPGVLAVVTSEDLGPAAEPMPIYAPHPALPRPCGIRPLARDVVRFVGESVAAVVAADAYRAHDALERIRVDYDPRPAVVGVEAAVATGAPLVHDWLGTNVASEWQQRVGDVEGAIRAAEVVVRTRFRLSRGGAHPLEPRGLVAHWANGQLTVWAAVQMVHRHRAVFAGHLGLVEEQVRVIAPADVGGGFGTKGMYYPESLLSKLRRA